VGHCIVPGKRKTERTAELARQHIGYHIEQTKEELRRASYVILRLAPGAGWHLMGCGPSDIRLIHVACGCRQTQRQSRPALPRVTLPVYVNLLLAKPIFVKEIWRWQTSRKTSTFKVERLSG
jgi:hypothetical protein